MARFEKDFRQLTRRLDSVFDGQVRISVTNIFDDSQSKSDDEDEESSFGRFFVEITPKDGLYANASYIFSIKTNDYEYCYPACAPLISCLTRIYHPNINTRCKQFSDNVCVSILNDWGCDEGESTLEDIIQALLFLFYNPNLDDPLTSHISHNLVEFARNVRISIEGGSIEEFENTDFEVNYGYQRYLDLKERELEEIFFDITLDEPTVDQTTTNERSESLIETPVSLINTSTTQNKMTISS